MFFKFQKDEVFSYIKSRNIFSICFFMVTLRSETYYMIIYFFILFILLTFCDLLPTQCNHIISKQGIVKLIPTHCNTLLVSCIVELAQEENQTRFLSRPTQTATSRQVRTVLSPLCPAWPWHHLSIWQLKIAAIHQFTDSNNNLKPCTSALWGKFQLSSDLDMVSQSKLKWQLQPSEFHIA